MPTTATWRPPQQLCASDPTWKRMAEAEREEVRRWLRSLGVDPADIRGYRVQGDQLLCEVFCRADPDDGMAHLHRACPAHTQAQHEDGCQLNLNDVCTRMELC